ncbi:hypothetical protein MKX01_027715 [Papaver californicum]|nr:hypothetical protein MKX01_027715 [Papaver californicum]
MKDKLIHCFGFGDDKLSSTQVQDVFSFHEDKLACNGLLEVLTRYRSRPTSYVAIIEMDMAIVGGSVGKHNVLLIIGDSRVTRSVDTDSDKLSWFEQKTIDAIAKAKLSFSILCLSFVSDCVWYLFLLWSCFIRRLHLCREYPLSIIVVGVGDEPPSMMFSCSKNSSLCAYDNFKLCWVSVFSVCEFYMEIMSKDVHLSRKEIEFALAAAFTEISQHKNTYKRKLGFSCKEVASERVPLLPPIHISASLVSKSYFPEIQRRENTIHDESGPWFDRLEHECPISMISGYEGVIHIGNFPVPASFEALYKKIWEKHGHLATHNIIKTSTLTLVTLVAELLKSITAMESLKRDKFSASLLGKVDRQIEDAEALQFNVQRLRRHFEKVKKIWETEKHC